MMRLLIQCPFLCSISPNVAAYEGVYEVAGTLPEPDVEAWALVP